MFHGEDDGPKGCGCSTAQGRWRYPWLACLAAAALAACGGLLWWYIRHGRAASPQGLDALVAEWQGGVTFFKVRPLGAGLEQRPPVRRARARGSALEVSLSPTAKSGDSALLGDTVVMVRTYNPTAAQSAKITEWFSSLKDSGAQLLVSIDMTRKGANKAVGLLKELSEAGLAVEGESIHRYTAEDMLKHYPKLAGMTEIPYQYHSQAVDLWWQEQRRGGRPGPGHVWILEDDLGYTGNMANFLESYTKDGADLIAGVQQQWAHPASRDWHPKTPTTLFLQRVPLPQRFGIKEHATRMSAALLNRLHDWSVEGAMDLSEAMPGTVCKMEGMSCKPFREEDLGHPFSCCEGRISEKDWSKHSLDDRAQNHGRLYHPLKF